MMTDTEIRVKGVETLTKALGMVEAERFIGLMIRDVGEPSSLGGRPRQLRALGEHPYHDACRNSHGFS